VEHRAFPSDAESYHLSARQQQGASAAGTHFSGLDFDSENAVVNRDAFEDWEG
jgi:hypothetical protein